MCLSLSRRVQVISGAVDLFIRKHLNVTIIHPNSDQLFIIFKMAIIEGNVTEKISSEVYLFGSIMQRYDIENLNANMLRWQLSNQLWPLNLRLRLQKIFTWTLTSFSCICSPRSPKQTEQTSKRTKWLHSTWRVTQCFVRLIWSWTVEMWATRSNSTRIANTWRFFLTFASRFKKTFFCARAKPRIPPSTWMSP